MPLPWTARVAGCLAVLAALAGSCAATEPEGATPPGAERRVPATTTTAPVTTAPPAAASPTTTQPPCCGEGSLDLFVTAKSAFDPWTRDGDWDWMNEHYTSMVVWTPYWDGRLAHYDDVTVYRDAYAIKVNTRVDTRAVEHPEWILRTASGAPVYIPWGCADGCPQYAADIGDPAFVAHWIETTRTIVDRGYTGLLIDDVNLAWRFSDVHGDPVEPIDPRTGTILTLADWQRAMVDFTEAVRAAFPDLEIWHNSIWYVDSPSFDNELVDRQLRAADVIQLERGVTDRGLTAGAGTYGMETFMAFVDRVHANGAAVALLDETATDEQGQWFNIAGALLVNDGADLVTTEDWAHIAPGTLFPGYRADLGDALGPRRVVDGTIRREFTDGLVIMNQPDAAPVTVPLDGTWRTPAGTDVTAVTLGPAEAIVLTRP